MTFWNCKCNWSHCPMCVSDKLKRTAAQQEAWDKRIKKSGEKS